MGPQKAKLNMDFKDSYAKKIFSLEHTLLTQLTKLAFLFTIESIQIQSGL